MGTCARNTNIELYRIIAMLFIIAHHYVVNSGLLDVIEIEPISFKSFFVYILGAWGKVGINCFVLITGYFMWKQKITLRKFLKLVLEVVFYNLIIYLAFVITGYSNFSVLEFIYSLLPVKSVASGFTSSFIIFYLFIPFLNILIKNLDTRNHLLLIFLCLFIYTVLGSVPKINVQMNYVSWFIVLYFISSYIGKYGLFNRVTHSAWAWMSVLSIILAVLSIAVMLIISEVTGRKIFPYYWVNDSNKILALIVAITSFMYFHVF